MKPSSKKNVIRLLILVVLGLTIAASVYYYYATQTFDDTHTVKQDYTVTAAALLKEFSNNDSAANKKYAEKIMSVTGTVTSIEPVQNSVVLKMEDTTTHNYAIFEMQPQDSIRAASLKPGEEHTIKGSCSGGVLSEILGTLSVSFKRCTIL